MVIIVKWYNLFSYCKYLLKNRTRSISIMNMGFLVENILTKHYLCYFLIEMIVVTYSHVNCDKFVFDLCWLLLYMLILFWVISITFNLFFGIFPIFCAIETCFKIWIQASNYVIVNQKHFLIGFSLIVLPIFCFKQVSKAFLAIKI